MLRLLVRNENLQVIKVTLAVITPWTIQELLKGGTTSFLAHIGLRGVVQLKKARRSEGLWRGGLIRSIAIRPKI